MLQENTPRRATSQDVPHLCALINSAYRGESSKKGWTTETDLVGGRRMDEVTLAEMVAEDANVFLVFEDSAGLVASVYLQRREGRCYLGLLTVNPERQAGGLGRKLLEVAESFVVREWQLERIEMTVIRQRSELIAWYERRGYRWNGRTAPFQVNDERFGLPKVEGLEFVVLEKKLSRF